MRGGSSEGGGADLVKATATPSQAQPPPAKVPLQPRPSGSATRQNAPATSSPEAVSPPKSPGDQSPAASKPAKVPRRPFPQRQSARQSPPATIPPKAVSPPKCPGDQFPKGSQLTKTPRRLLPRRRRTRQSAGVGLTRAFWPVEVRRLPGSGPFWRAKMVRGRSGSHPFVRA